MANIDEIFDDASKKSGVTITEIEIAPVRINGTTHLCGVKLNGATKLLRLKACKLTNGNLFEPNDYIWISDQCFDNHVLNAAYADFRSEYFDSEDPIVLDLQYHVPGNCSLKEEKIFFSTKKRALKAVVEKRKETEGLKTKYIKLGQKQSLTIENFFKPISEIC